MIIIIIIIKQITHNIILTWKYYSRNSSMNHIIDRNANRYNAFGEHKPGRIKPGRTKRAALSLQSPKYILLFFDTTPFVCLWMPARSRPAATAGRPARRRRPRARRVAFAVLDAARHSFVCTAYRLRVVWFVYAWLHIVAFSGLELVEVEEGVLHVVGEVVVGLGVVLLC